MTTTILLGDANQDGTAKLLDVSPLVDRVASDEYQEETNVNRDGAVNLLDIGLFVAIPSD